MPKEPIAEWGCACGRVYLKVAGFIVAMETDPCREVDVPVEVLKAEAAKYPGLEDHFNGNRWTPGMIKWLADKINKEAESRA